MRKRTIRASEISTYLYCKRAWSYQREGRESQNLTEMAAGTEYHHRHGKALLHTLLLRSTAWLCLISALTLAVIWLIQRVYP